VRFQCPHCLGIVAIEDCEAGEAVACGHCDNALAVPNSPFSPGAVIGDFVISKELGAGGMGTVFLAHQVSLDRDAALKILHPQFSADQSYIADFIREARSAAALNHPNIVQAYAVGEDSGIYYFAMEYIAGTTLKQVLIHGGRIVVDRAVAIATEVAEALDFAWTNQGLVHGDIKPDNIILTSDGKIKLADLGLARKVSEMGEEGPEELFGTPQYISPEQILGGKADVRSDIYSLGATLYYTLTGRFPYSGDTPTDIARSHLANPLPPISGLVSDVPPAVEHVVGVMLAKRPDERYADAIALVEDLKIVAEGGAPTYPLSPESQLPIPFETDDGEEEAPVAALEAEAAAVMTAEPAEAEVIPEPPPVEAAPVAAAGAESAPTESKRRLKISSGGSKKLKLGTNTVSTPVPPTASEQEQPEEDGDQVLVTPGPRRMGFGKAIVITLTISAVIAGMATGAVALLVGGREDATGDGRPVQTAVSRSEKNALAKLQDLIDSGAADEEVPSEASRLLADGSPWKQAARETRAVAGPVTERQVRSLRQAQREAELKQWAAEAERLELEAKKAKEEEERLAREAEVRRRKEAEQARKAAEQRQRRDKLVAQQKGLRWEAVDLCREHKYDDAKILFGAMAQSRDQEFAEWAKGKTACIALADKAFHLVFNTKDKLKGTRVTRAGKSGKWYVVDIGRRSIRIQAKIQKFSQGKDTSQVASAKIALREVPDKIMWELCRASWAKDEGDEKELKLYFGAYLTSRGSALSTARTQLTESGRDAETAPILEEISVLGPVVRARQWEAALRQLKLYVNQGDMKLARRFASHIKQRFPGEFAEAEGTVRGILNQ
jgi:serine/threonine protein kinase